MLIKKGGISRNIDSSRLDEYEAKGYEVAGDQPEANALAEKNFVRMTNAELEALALEMEVDLTGCKNKAERVLLLETARAQVEE
ncbi:MAG TPA: hypothetical protein VN441_14705 [Syntrophomonas sp.]|jgi:hypothetical protein|nr:hypothetical protein [Syntrophomonas sp.]